MEREDYAPKPDTKTNTVSTTIRLMAEAFWGLHQRLPCRDAGRFSGIQSSSGVSPLTWLGRERLDVVTDSQKLDAERQPHHRAGQPGGVGKGFFFLFFFFAGWNPLTFKADTHGTPKSWSQN